MQKWGEGKRERERKERNEKGKGKAEKGIETRDEKKQLSNVRTRGCLYIPPAAEHTLRQGTSEEKNKRWKQFRQSRPTSWVMFQDDR